MKSLFKKNIDIVFYTICGVLLVLGSYNILINVNHASYLNTKVVVSEKDNNYKVYKENVLKIEERISKKNNNQINQVLSLMKKSDAYKLMPGEKLSYGDLYQLNNYFVDVLINEGWVSNLKLSSVYNNRDNNDYMNVLINNCDYLNKELLNNSNYHYDVKNNDIRNTIDEEYQLIMANYKNYSSLVLSFLEKDGE